MGAVGNVADRPYIRDKGTVHKNRIIVLKLKSKSFLPIIIVARRRERMTMYKQSAPTGVKPNQG